MTITASVLPICAEKPPLRVDPGGVVRVGSSRISLDLVVEQYDNGMTPEEMVHAYDTLVLADVYSAIGYYLRHCGDVQKYLEHRRDEAESLRVTIETQNPPVSQYALLARRATSEPADAQLG